MSSSFWNESSTGPFAENFSFSHGKRSPACGASTLARLFDTRVILNYRNGAEWFDIHPLLWPLIDGLGEPDARPAGA